MPKTNKTVLTPEQIKKRDALKALLPTGWRKTLMEKTDRRGKYLSNMVNEYKIDKPEWRLLLELADEHKAVIEKNEADTSQLLSA